MRPEIRAMSLYRAAQIVDAMPNDHKSRRVIRFVKDLLDKEEEPKPIIALQRILEKCSANGQVVNNSHFTLQSLLRVILDPTQVDMNNINVRLRVVMLDKLADIAKYQSPALIRPTTEACEKLMESI